MRTLAAFLATVAIAVPAAWHVLGADIKRDGPATRPKQETLDIDDTTHVTVDLDRGILMAGGKLVAKLVATSDTPKKIALDVRALENMGYGDERVENPPREAGRRRITIEAAPGGGKPVEVAFTLGEPGKRGVVRWFDVVVTQDVKRKKGEDEDPYSGARAGAATWSGNSYPVAIETPAVLPADAPFQVAVRVTNTTKRPLRYLTIELGGTMFYVGGLDTTMTMSTFSYDDDRMPYKIESLTDNEVDEPLAPGQSRLANFLVTPRPMAEGGVSAYTFTAHANDQRGGAMDVETYAAKMTTSDQPVAVK